MQWHRNSGIQHDHPGSSNRGGINEIRYPVPRGFVRYGDPTNRFLINTSGRLVMNPLYAEMRKLSPGIDKKGVTKDLVIIAGGSVPVGTLLGKLWKPLADAATWTLGPGKSAAKWAGQMQKRGWTPKQIDDAIQSGKQYPAANNLNPANGATRFVNPQTGRSVVIDNKTGQVIHVGGDGYKY